MTMRKDASVVALATLFAVAGACALGLSGTGQARTWIASAEALAPGGAAVAPARFVPAPPVATGTEFGPPLTPSVPPADADGSSAANRYDTLGSAPLDGLREERDGVVSLRRVVVAPDADFRLSRLAGSGLVVVEAGRLELIEQNDAVHLSHGRGAIPAGRGVSARLIVGPGDQLALAPGANLQLHNPNAFEAEVLIVFVLINPRIQASDLAMSVDRGS